MTIRGIASMDEKISLAYDLTMAYLSQQDNSNLSPTEYYEKFKAVRSEIFNQLKDLTNPFQP